MNNEPLVLGTAGFVPVESKLRAPRLRNDYVMRGQIVDRLIDAVDLPLVLVTAPPGYGKTTTIAQWAAEDPRPFAWLTLDDSDNDPAFLFTYLLLALQRIDTVDEAILATLTGSDRSISDVGLPRLGRMLADRRRSFVVVLDEADALKSAAALRIVSSLENHLPENSQLALIAREVPRLDWTKMRVKRRLLEIGGDDLRLSRAETVALAEAAGLHLDDEDVEALMARTEGWAAATYLAAVAMSKVPDQRRSTIDLLGSKSVVASYLRDELVATRDPGEQEFLRRTSILKSLCGPLCDATLSTTGSDVLLRRLVRSNTLVERVDGQELWYRTHPLLAEVLKAELYRIEPRVTRSLHDRASMWFEDYGDAESAISHAVFAADTDRAARLIWGQTADCVAAGRTATLERWLDSYTPRQVVGNAKLALTATWCALQRGHSPDPWLSTAERGAYNGTRKGEPEEIAAATLLLHVAIAQNGVTQMSADAELAMQLQTPDDPWRCVAEVLDGVSTYLAGHPAEARCKLAKAERSAVAFNNPHVRVTALVHMALIAIDEDDWNSANEFMDRAQALLKEFSLANVPDLITAHCTTALLSAEHGHESEAAALTRECTARLVTYTFLPPWQALQCRYLLSRAELVVGHPAAARTLLSEATTLLIDVPDAIVIRDAINRLWEQIEKRPLMVGGKAQTITSAELRVLRLLPTHYSFEQIGRQLFVSRNTVKTQAISVYRKLGASSRAEAVERAHALGLTKK